MTGTDRRISEQQFHDRQAAERAERFRSARADLAFTDDEFLNHETWIRPAFHRVLDGREGLAGLQALDYGCGHGMAAVVLARAGASVTAFDLSPGYVAEAAERAAPMVFRWNVSWRMVKNCRSTCALRCGLGNAILHHLDLARAGRELRRVLKPGGVAVFCEPWGGNPLLGFARRRLPYPGKERTPDESPLTARDLAPLRELFPVVNVQGYQFFGMVRRVWRDRRLCRVLDAVDARLLRLAPALQNWCRYAVISLSPTAGRAEGSDRPGRTEFDRRGSR